MLSRETPRAPAANQSYLAALLACRAHDWQAAKSYVGQPRPPQADGRHVFCVSTLPCSFLSNPILKMRLLKWNSAGDFVLTEDFVGDDAPPYAILSHTWRQGEEVTFNDLMNGTGNGKSGFNKIHFCGKQARLDGLQYFWVDTCCIEKSSSAELTKAINSMFCWYQNAAKCYVYLSDVSIGDCDQSGQLSQFQWESAFRVSRWFTRGWTLQELLAPASVEFFSREGKRLGDKKSLEPQIHEITGIAHSALQGSPLSRFSVAERFSWVEKRSTTRKEDLAYSMPGIFDIHMPLIYGEGRDKAFIRLEKKIAKSKRANAPYKSRNLLSYSLQRTTTPEIEDRTQGATIEIQHQPRLTKPNQRDLEFPGRTRTPPSGRPSVRSIREQTMGAVTSLVEETQHAITLGNVPLHRHLAQIYRELGRNRAQLQRLARIIGTYEASGRERSRTPSRTNTPAEDTDALEVRDFHGLSLYADYDATDIFFDCVSRYSEDESDAPLERSRARFSGSPDYFLEASSEFLPEQYTVPGRFNGTVSIVAMVEVGYTSTYRLHKYFLFFAETPRIWRRVTVSATIITSSQNSALSWITSPDLPEQGSPTLPGDLQSQLERVLGSKRLFETVTRVSLIIAEDASGKFSIDAAHAGITEDLEEARMSNEETILQDIEDIGCPKFVQNDVIVRSRVRACSHLVQVQSGSYVERKLPFAGAGLPDDDGVDDDRMSDFFNDIKLLRSLHECSAVVKFAGVVLDDTRKHLNSYLCEWPALGWVLRIFNVAELRGERIPWEIREAWARQTIAAVSDVHARDVVLGVLSLQTILIRADGSAVLDAPKGSSRRTLNQRGWLAPELRSTPNSAPSYKRMNFRTDVFQLGLVLWLLAEHKVMVGDLCPRYACTRWPRYSCEEHHNPIDLPPCSSAEVPRYMDVVISHCRQNDPRKRLLARELLHYFPEKSPPAQMADLATTYPEKEGDHYWARCDECGALAVVHYHCNTCQLGNFDLCSDCVSQGIHCFVPEHRLIKRIWTNRGLISAQEYRS